MLDADRPSRWQPRGAHAITGQVPRFLQLVAVVLAFMVSGAPSWATELAGDDCAQKCTNESTCPDEGCGDCSIICSSCPRVHVVVPQQASVLAAFAVAWTSHDVSERVPVGPHPDGVFHPPRDAG